VEFSRFLGQLESLARFTSDSAKLVTPTLDVSLSLDGCGKIILEGELRSEVGNKLVFRMALDQSYLHDPIKVPRGLLAQYPV
jgi:hypothetical protein